MSDIFDLSAFLIHKNETLCTAMSRLYYVFGRTLFVVDDEEHLIGTFSPSNIPLYRLAAGADGAGQSVNPSDPVESYCAKEPKYMALTDDPYAKGLALFSEHPTMRVIPVIDGTGAVRDLFFRIQAFYREYLRETFMDSQFYVKGIPQGIFKCDEKEFAYSVWDAAEEAKFAGKSGVSVLYMAARRDPGYSLCELHAQEISRCLGICIEVCGLIQNPEPSALSRITGLCSAASRGGSISSRLFGGDLPSDWNAFLRKNVAFPVGALHVSNITSTIFKSMISLLDSRDEFFMPRMQFWAENPQITAIMDCFCRDRGYLSCVRPKLEMEIFSNRDPEKYAEKRIVKRNSHSEYPLSRQSHRQSAAVMIETRFLEKNERKFPQIHIEESLRHYARLYPDYKFTVLVDHDDYDNRVNPFNVRKLPPEALSNLDKVSDIVIYACRYDQDAIAHVRTLYNKGINVLGHHPWSLCHTSHYLHLSRGAMHSMAKTYAADTLERPDVSKFSFDDFANLLAGVDATRHIPGDYVEVGVLNGSSALAVLGHMRNSAIAADCYFYDVFNGFNYEEAYTSSDAIWRGRHSSIGLEAVTKRLKAFESLQNGLRVTVEKRNIISDDLPNRAIRMANIDVDLYEAVCAALAKIAPKMSKGGIIFVEDPSHTPALIGSRLALEDFLLYNPVAKDFILLYAARAQFMLIRLQ